jgi:sulfite exporter TauE/SafE
VQRDLGRITGYAAAGAEAGGVGAGATEIVEPKLRVIAPGVILDQLLIMPARSGG